MSASKVSQEEREEHAKIGERWCSKCSDWMSVKLFTSSKSICRICRADESIARREANPDKVKSMTLKKYGLTLEQFNEMKASQNGMCLICKSVPIQLSVDHDHQTEEIRGLLCNNCNPGLGYFKDNPELLRAAAEYLERHSCVSVEL